MIRQQSRTAAVAAALVVAAALLWWGLGSRPASTAEPSGRRTGSIVELGHEQVLRPPTDLEAARKVAGDFAVALYRDDVEGMQTIMTEAFSDRLLRNAAGASTHVHDVTVDGMTTEDLQQDRAVLEVVVRRLSDDIERLDVVRVALVRVEGRWLVNDAAF